MTETPDEEERDSGILKREPASKSFMREHKSRPKRFTVDHIAAAFDATKREVKGDKYLWANVRYIDDMTVPRITASRNFSRMPALEKVKQISWLASGSDGSYLFVSFEPKGLQFMVHTERERSNADAIRESVEHAVASVDPPAPRNYRNAILQSSSLALVFLLITLLVRATLNLPIDNFTVKIAAAVIISLGVGVLVGNLIARLIRKHHQWLYLRDSQIAKLTQTEKVTIGVGVLGLVGTLLIGLTT